MFRFSIRELMLITLVVGLGFGWGLDHARLLSRIANWRHCTGALEHAFVKLDYEVSWTEDRSEVKVSKTDGDWTRSYHYDTDPYEPGTISVSYTHLRAHET